MLQTTGIENEVADFYHVSITLRWHRCFRQVFINNDVSKPFVGVYERKVVKYIVNELLMQGLALCLPYSYIIHYFIHDVNIKNALIREHF